MFCTSVLKTVPCQRTTLHSPVVAPISHRDYPCLRLITRFMLKITLRKKAKQFGKLVRHSAMTPRTGVAHKPIQAKPQELGITFIGHSSFLIQIGGKNVIVDPELCSVDLRPQTLTPSRRSHRRSSAHRSHSRFARPLRSPAPPLASRHRALQCQALRKAPDHRRSPQRR